MRNWIYMMCSIVIGIRNSITECDVSYNHKLDGNYYDWNNWYINRHHLNLHFQAIPAITECDNLHPLTNNDSEFILMKKVFVRLDLKTIESHTNYTIPIGIEMLLINNTGLERISEGGFLGLNVTNTLNLSHNALCDINDKVFDNLLDLKILDISHNEINIIHPEAFVQNRKLTSLYLNHNKLKILEEPIFNTQVSLNILDLSNNPVEKYDKSLILNSKNLKVLSLNNLDLDDFSVSRECELQELYFSGNKFDLSNEHLLNQITDLLIFDLSRNNIKTLDVVCFKNMVPLKKLILRNNNIQGLTNNHFTSMLQLEYLDLSYNNLQNISIDSTLNLVKLRKMYMDGGYANLTGTIFSKVSKNFTTLSLGHNFLTQIDSQTFKNLKLLHYLDLNDNSINVIHQDSFVDLEKITILNLRNNTIKNLPSTLLRNTISLQELDLSQNNLTQIDIGSFDSCQNLLLLNLSYNHITTISKQVLYPLKHLQALYVHENDLVTIDGLTYLSQLKLISLQNNNWDCHYLHEVIETLDYIRAQITGVSSLHTDGHVRLIACHTKRVNASAIEESETAKPQQDSEVLASYVIDTLDDINVNLKNIPAAMGEILKKAMKIPNDETYANPKPQENDGNIKDCKNHSLNNINKNLQNISRILNIKEDNKSTVPLFYSLIFIGVCTLAISAVNMYMKLSKVRRKPLNQETLLL